MMWQSHTQYQHVPSWNKAPGGQFGDTGISFGHAVSTDLAHWTQVENALWPDEWFTSVSVYDGSATVIDDRTVIIIAAGLTPNTTSVRLHRGCSHAGLVLTPVAIFLFRRSNRIVPVYRYFATRGQPQPTSVTPTLSIGVGMPTLCTVATRPTTSGRLTPRAVHGRPRSGSGSTSTVQATSSCPMTVHTGEARFR
eukprot:m.60126 g.60126  ORF g.60126 m.60126 type:complete len:195 (+) comp9493_c0_seq4:585-1169(+)